MPLYLLTNHEAEYLGNAVAVAGGAVYVHPDCRLAVADVLERHAYDNGAVSPEREIVADLPAGMFPRFRCTPLRHAAEIVQALRRGQRWPIVSDDGTECAELANIVAKAVRA